MSILCTCFQVPRWRTESIPNGSQTAKSGGETTVKSSQYRQSVAATASPSAALAHHHELPLARSSCYAGQVEHLRASHPPSDSEDTAQIGSQLPASHHLLGSGAFSHPLFSLPFGYPKSFVLQVGKGSRGYRFQFVSLSHGGFNTLLYQLLSVNPARRSCDFVHTPRLSLANSHTLSTAPAVNCEKDLIKSSGE